MVEKIHTKIFGSNGTFIHTIKERNRMEIGHRTRTGARKKKKIANDKTNTSMP